MTREAFKEWWEKEGQFHRAGGGGYERTFAFHTWQAATAAAVPPGYAVVPKSEAQDAKRWQFFCKAWGNTDTPEYDALMGGLVHSQGNDEANAAIDAAMLEAAPKEQSNG